MKRLLSSKKGIRRSISDMLRVILDVTPKPILFLLFIFLLTAISTFFMPLVLNMFGYECLTVEGDNVLYQIPMNTIVNIIGKFQLDVRQFQEEYLGVEVYELPEEPFPNGNKSLLRIPDECFVETELNGTTFTGYSALCMECETSREYFWQAFWTPLKDLVCVGDATEQRDLGRTFYTNAGFCNLCTAPTEYYYNHTYCLTHDECHFLIRPEYADRLDEIDADWENQLYYEKIIEMGGVERTQDATDFANIQCDTSNKPQLYFYSIKVFDRTLWIYLFIAFALISFAFSWYGMVL